MLWLVGSKVTGEEEVMFSVSDRNRTTQFGIAFQLPTAAPLDAAEVHGQGCGGGVEVGLNNAEQVT